MERKRSILRWKESDGADQVLSGVEGSQSKERKEGSLSD